MESTQTHEFLTVKEVAARLRVTPLTVRAWITKGILPAIQLPGAHRIRRDDYERFAKIRGGSH